jgi:hypothetical protein
LWCVFSRQNDFQELWSTYQFLMKGKCRKKKFESHISRITKK